MKPVTFALLLALTAMAFAVAEEPKTSADEPAKDIEKVLDAADAPREAPLRPLKELAKFKLSNLRFEVPGPGQQALLKVHYELVSAGDLPNPVLVLRTADGKQRFVNGRLGGRNALQDKAGDLGFGLAFARVGENTKDLEAYLVFTDRRWEDEDFKPMSKFELGGHWRPRSSLAVRPRVDP